MRKSALLILIYFQFASPIMIAQLPLAAGIREIRTDEQTFYPPFDSIILQPEEDDLHIYFVDTPSVDRYQFQLLAFEKDTISSVYPFTRYTNLKGGAYHFHLWSQKGEHTSQPSKLSITVQPKVVESAWFFPLLALYVTLVVFAIAFFWIMYHYRQKMRLQKLRNRIADDLHDEVGSTLSSIAIFAKALKKSTKSQEGYVVDTLNNIIQSSEQTNHHLHDTVWALNPQLDKAGDLFEKIRSTAAQLFAAADIQLSFPTDLTAVKDIPLSMLQRRNIYLICCEAINNIVKHAQASEVSMAITKEGKKIRFTIEDNGIGFDQNQASSGNGLKSLRRRAQESYIHYQLSAHPNQGTTITMLIPPL